MSVCNSDFQINASVIESTIDIGCCLAIIFHQLYFSNIKLWSIVNITVAVSIRAFGNMLSVSDDLSDSICKLQGFMKNFGGLATFLFVLYTSIHMMQKCELFQCWRIFQIHYDYPYILIWVLALFISSIPLYSHDGYVKMGKIHWCWINPKES